MRAAEQRTWTIKQAAAQAGFCDVFHFFRRFKQIIGESPARFRERVRMARGIDSRTTRAIS